MICAYYEINSAAAVSAQGPCGDMGFSVLPQPPWGLDMLVLHRGANGAAVQVNLLAVRKPYSSGSASVHVGNVMRTAMGGAFATKSGCRNQQYELRITIGVQNIAKAGGRQDMS